MEVHWDDTLRGVEERQREYGEKPSLALTHQVEQKQRFVRRRARAQSLAELPLRLLHSEKALFAPMEGAQVEHGVGEVG
jgi:hypothetical protein